MTSSRKGYHYRLAVVNSHPIQYFAPLYRRIAASPDIEIQVYYCSRQGQDAGFIDPGFGKEIVWDVPLLEGYPYKFLANVGRDRGARDFFSLINPSIVAELRRERFDAVIVHGHNSVVNLLALLAAKTSGTRIFMRGETHLQLRSHPLKRALRRPLLGLLYAMCDAFLCIGTRNREFYLAQGVPTRKLFLVPYAVDNQAFAARAQASVTDSAMRRSALGLPPDMPVILYASKLTARKRPRDLVRARAELDRRGIRAALLIVGDGEERAALKREVKSSGLMHIVFPGFVNQADLPLYYALADVFVLPSEDEPWGLAINEAMACGVPVVTTREVGAAADLVQDGETGYTYEAGDIVALADALAKVLVDRSSGKAMRQKSEQRMVLWSYDQTVTGIREALQTIPPRTRS